MKHTEQSLSLQQTIITIFQALRGTQKWASVFLWLWESSWAEWLILSWTTVEWTSGSSFQRAAIIWTGLTGLLRGGPSKNMPYLCDSMMTLTSAAVSRSCNFSPIPFSLPRRASPLFSFDHETSPSAANTAPPQPWRVFLSTVSHRGQCFFSGRCRSEAHDDPASWRFEETHREAKGFSEEWKGSRRKGRGRTGLVDDLTWASLLNFSSGATGPQA